LRPFFKPPAFLSRGRVIPPTLSAAVMAPAPPWPHGDPCDRGIVATAIDLGVPLITKDANIADAGVADVLW
jgi:PIN domain nuclease of toxin-antitoxin system